MSGKTSETGRGADRPLRLVYCTSGGLYGALVLARLLQSPDVELAGLVISTRVLSKRFGWLRGGVEQVRRSGVAYALYLAAVTGGTDMLSPQTRVSKQAASRGIPVFSTRDINDAAGLAFVESCTPDLLLSGFFNQRLGEQVCASARMGAVNIHPGELPTFKGVDPVFHALSRGESTLGASLHRVTPAFDAGPLLADRQIAAREEESVARVTARLFSVGADLLVESLPDIRRGSPGVPQSGTGAYDSWPSPDVVSLFRARGRVLVRPTELRELLNGAAARADSAE